MGWFDEQLRQRNHIDQEEFEESMLQMAASLIGKRETALDDPDELTLDAVNEILKYYKLKPVEVPDSLEGADEQMRYCLHKYGLMKRRVELRDKWWRDSTGPLILYKKDSDIPVVARPRSFGGYEIIEGGIKTRVNAEVFAEYKSRALCFYRPLPSRSLNVKDLITYMKNCLQKSDYVFVILLTLVVALVGMLLPKIARMLTSVVYESGSMSLLIATAEYILAVLISSALFSMLNSLMLARLTSKTSLSVEAAVMMRVMNLPAEFFRRFNSGELYSRVNSVHSLCDAIVNSILGTGLTSLASLLYIGQIASYAPSLVIPSLAIIIGTFVISLVTAVIQARISRESMVYMSKESGLSYSLISGVQKIRLSGAEKRAFSKWATAYSKGASYIYNPPLFLKISGAVTALVSLAGTVVLYFVASANGVNPSEYYSFTISFGVVMGAFNALAGIAKTIASIRPILDLAEPILKTEPEIAEEKEILTSVQGGIALNNVYFRYTPNMPFVIDNLSLKIRPGEYVAIVGRTGCGKSTLLRLLLGFEKPEKGAIYYDGRDLSPLDLQSLRRKVGTVMQSGSLFQGSIYSNIVISSPQLALDAAWEAAEIAGIADDIRSMPMGMFTMVGEGAGGISGGQKQRLMIARAIAPKPKILMFDEATSALDNKTQKQVSEALDKLKCTRIIIAHRLSTIRHCDRILMIEGGRIVESGSYDELIAKKGKFADLVERQRMDLDQ